MHVEPYLHFDGRCEEAIEFYKTALGAEVQMLMRYKDMPEPRQPGSIPPGSENKVMHASVRIGESAGTASTHRVGRRLTFEYTKSATTSRSTPFSTIQSLPVTPASSVPSAM